MLHDLIEQLDLHALPTLSAETPHYGARPISSLPARDVVLGRNLGSGTVPGLVAAHLAQCADPTGGSVPPLQPAKRGHPMFLQAGTYVTVQDVVEGWLQVMEVNAPK